MKKKKLYIILIAFCLLVCQIGISNGATETLGPESIVYPVPSEKKDGTITYMVWYDGNKTNLRFSQNETWTINKKDVRTGVMQVDIIVPYTEVRENSLIPTKISHKLEAYDIGNYINRVTYEAEFEVPVLKFAGIRNRIINLTVGKETVLKAITAKVQFKSNPDDYESFNYIWDNFKIRSSNIDIVEISNIDCDYTTRKINITLKGKKAGKAEITLVSPTNQVINLANVTVKNSTEDENSGYEIYEEKYFCRVKTLSLLADIKGNVEGNKNIIIKDKNGQTIQESDIIKTGMKIQIDNKEYAISVEGDTNGDGKITVTDLSKTKLHLVELSLLNNEYKWAADMNGDKRITITDMSRLKIILVK